MRWLYIITVLSFCSWAEGTKKTLFAAGDGGYSQFHLAGSGGTLPTYRGSVIGGSINYQVKFDNGFFIGPYLSGAKGTYANIKNSTAMSENITSDIFAYGLKLGVKFAYFKAGLAQIELTDVASANGNSATIRSRTVGGQLAVGFDFKLSDFVGFGVSLKSNFASFTPDKEGFSQNTHFIDYGAFVNLTFGLPSSSSSSVRD